MLWPVFHMHTKNFQKLWSGINSPMILVPHIQRLLNKNFCLLHVSRVLKRNTCTHLSNSWAGINFYLYSYGARNCLVILRPKHNPQRPCKYQGMMIHTRSHFGLLKKLWKIFKNLLLLPWTLLTYCLLASGKHSWVSTTQLVCTTHHLWEISGSSKTVLMI